MVIIKISNNDLGIFNPLLWLIAAVIVLPMGYALMLGEMTVGRVFLCAVLLGVALFLHLLSLCCWAMGKLFRRFFGGR